LRNAAAQTLEEEAGVNVECIFSEVEKMTGHAAALYYKCKNEMDLGDKLAGTFAIGTPHDLPELQAADMIAYEIRLFVSNGTPFQGALTINNVQKPSDVRWPMYQILLQKPTRTFFHFLTLESLKGRLKP